MEHAASSGKAQGRTSCARGKGPAFLLRPATAAICTWPARGRRGYPMTAPRLEHRHLEGFRVEVHLAYPHEGQGPEPSQMLRIAHFPDNSWSSCPTDSVQPTGAAQTRRAQGPKTRRIGRSEHGSAIPAIPPKSK